MGNLIMTVFFIFGLFVTYTTVQSVSQEVSSSCPNNQLVTGESLSGVFTCQTHLLRATKTITDSTSTPKSTGLNFSISANMNYSFVAYIYVNNTANGDSPNFRITGVPAGLTAQVYCAQNFLIVSGNSCITGSGSNIFVQFNPSASETDIPYVIWGSFQVGANSGTMNISFLNVNSGTGSVSVKIGSWIEYNVIN